MKERDLSKLNINERINCIAVELQAMKLKKSGKNKHAGFEYFELSDFLPALNQLMKVYEVNSIFTIHSDYARLILKYKDQQEEYLLPYHDYDVPVSKSGSPMMQQIQYLGAKNTYYKRYLYINAFGITDGDVIDAMDNKHITKPELTPDHEKWQEAKKYIQEGGDISNIKKRYAISLENINILKS